MDYKIFQADCLEYLKTSSNEIGTVDLTFLDPPFNQNKEYASYNDNLPESVYWEMMKNVCENLFKVTSEGGAIYFMQREKKILNLY